MNFQVRRWSGLRSCLLLSATLALAGCAGQAPVSPFSNGPPASLTPIGVPPPSVAQGYGKTSGNVLMLAPLTGPLAAVGQVLVNAARLAYPAGSSPGLDVRDSQGTPAGATAAAQAGIAAGDGVIIGPLTSGETQAVAPIAKAAGVNMLPFTNDGTVAQPGVWPLGITPAQQVQRVLQVASDAGRTQLAALLPDNDFGHHLSDAITAETQALSEPAPQITFYQPGFDSVNQAVDQMSDFADRGQSIMDQIKQAQDLGTPAGRAKARQLQLQQIPPPSFNALFIGETDENTLAELANFLPYYDVSPPGVQFLGPAPWASIATDMAHQSVFEGAMYAAPDPAAAQAFVAKYQAAYGSPPPAIAGVAFDAAALAHVAGLSGGYTSGVLTASSGFTGTDGVLVLNPDGSVKRGLAVFSVAPGAPSITSPAPASLNQPPA